MPMLLVCCVTHCVSSREPLTTDDASVLGGQVQSSSSRAAAAVCNSSLWRGVAWRDVRAMQVKSGLGGRAAWDLGTAKC